MTAPRLHVLHENPDWLPPFAAALDEAGVPWEEWFLAGGELDLDAPPPPGVFWSRMSASSHTRGHGVSKDHTRGVLSWLEAAGARVVNGRRVLELEMSKVDQLAALRAAGIAVPRTVAVSAPTGTAGSPPPAGSAAPFLTKHNQGGKGLGVQRFDSVDALAAALDAPDWEEPVDGVLLLQELIVADQPRITRVEIVGGEVVYALTADTSQGFELCPAEACRIEDLSCPAPGSTGTTTGLFELRKDVDEALLASYVAFTRRTGIEVAGIEFIEAADGRVLTYDVNTNTNYNPDVEAVAPKSGPAEIARHLGRLLAEL